MSRRTRADCVVLGWQLLRRPWTSLAWLCIDRPPTDQPPNFPVRRAPPYSGTSSLFSEMPMRREWKPTTLPPVPARFSPAPVPKSKRPAFSRKNSRFSGKKSENRVRFTC